MRAIINGKSQLIGADATIAALLASHGMHADRVVVEVNGAIIQRDTFDCTPINDGDRIEIVQFVGGG